MISYRGKSALKFFLLFCLPSVFSYYNPGEAPSSSDLFEPSKRHRAPSLLWNVNGQQENNVFDRKRRASEPRTRVSRQSSTPDNTYKVVCYYTNYAWYRSGIGKYSPRDIDPTLCTHIVYGFGKLDADQYFIKESDNWADIQSRLYEKVTSLKKHGVKVVIGIGGWEDSSGDKYSRLVNSPTRRRRFIEHLLQFLYQHGFDGVELDWVYPKCWQLDCNKGPVSDKDAFAALVRELRSAFKPQGLLLSATMPPTKHPIDVGYNIPEISENLDWMTVKTYDYHGHWDKRTGHGAPLYAQPDDDDNTLSVNFSISYLLSKGADSRKLVFGIPMFGNSFTLNSNDDHGLYAYSSGPGERGEQSTAPGILAYYEICDRVQKRGWSVVTDPEGSMGPYARHENQWVSYDDPSMIRRKAEYIRANKLGGAMIYTLDYDDFRNHCGSGKYPLLQALNVVLRQNADSSVDTSLITAGVHKTEQESTERTSEQQTTQRLTPVETTTEQQTTQRLTPMETTTQEPTTERTTTERQTERTTIASTSTASQPSKVVCYFTNWAWYRQGQGKFLPHNIDASLCTHIVYAFATLDSSSLTIKSKDQWADIDNDLFRQVTRLRDKGVKVLLALGGWDDSQDDKFSRLVNDPGARGRFISHLSEFLRQHNFDGVNLHWEYPKCWQLNCGAGPDSDKESFAALVKELSRELKPRGMLMSAIVARSNMVVEQAYDVKTLSEHLDWLELKAYDYRGSWDRRTGHGSPLFYAEGDVSPYMNVNFSVNYWLEAGAAREKLVLSVPLYGQTFTLRNASQTSLGSPASGPGNPGPYTSSAGIMAFYEICEKVHSEGWKVEKPPVGTMAYHDTQWVSYDDISDILRKAQYVKDVGLGGIMIWSLSFDDFNNNCGCGKFPLLRAVNHGLRGLSLDPSIPNNCTAPFVTVK